MEGVYKRRRRARLEEEHNRDGHWTRSFSARTEPWVTVERWASQRGFRLVATRGTGRRLYLKGNGSRFYRYFVDVKAAGEGRGLTLAAWVDVGFLPRLFSAFRLPREMNPDPTGIAGVRARRYLCRELNRLLAEFKQMPIIGSGGFHVADQDLTVLLLWGACLASLVALAAPAARVIDIRAGLSNPLIEMLGRKLGWVAALWVFLTGVQWGVARKLDRMLFKGLAAGACYLVFAVTCIYQFTRTSSEAFEMKLTYYCVQGHSGDECRNLLARLSARDRELVLARLRYLQKELALGPAKPSK